MFCFICSFVLYRLDNSSIISDRLKSSKTVWPIPQIEQVFLPDFKIKSQINEHSFEVIIKLNIFFNSYIYLSKPYIF